MVFYSMNSFQPFQLAVIEIQWTLRWSTLNLTFFPTPSTISRTRDTHLYIYNIHNLQSIFQYWYCDFLKISIDIAYQYIGNILPPIIRYWCWSGIILLDQYKKYMPTIFQYLYCSSNTLPSIFQYWYNNFLKSKTLYSFCQYQCIVATCNMLLST